ncbi:MAG: DUF2079 domain-containing protein [Patescibacteria group bacterium]|nr:DUF2079 domain-containing protein [Patescibacteria group bacterium]
MDLKLFIRKNFWLILVLIAVGLHLAVALRLAFFWYNNYNIGKFDLGNAAQVVYNTLQGDFFVYTNEFGAQISRLSNHADFILLLFVPFFTIFKTPLVLVVAQCLALSISGVVIYLLAQEFNFSEFASFLFAAAYLFNADVGYLALDAFHGITFAIPFVLLSFYFLDKYSKSLKKRDLIWFLLMAFLVLISKEQTSLFIALLGLYAVFVKKQAKLGWGLFSVGVLWFVGYFFVVSPAFGEARIQSAEVYMQQLGLGAELGVDLRENPFISRYAHLGDSLIDLVTFPIRKPFLFLSAAFDWKYLKRILLPWGFLPLFAPGALILAVPQYLINVLSQGAFMTHRHYGVLHYISLIIPIVAYAAVLGADRVKKLLRKGSYKLEYLPALAVFVFSVFVAWNAENPVVVNPVVIGRSDVLLVVRKWAEEQELERLAALLGGTSSGDGDRESSAASDKEPVTDSGDRDEVGATEEPAKQVLKPRKATSVYILNPRHSGGYDLVFEYLKDKSGSISGPNSLGAKLVFRDNYNFFPLRWRDSKYAVVDLSGPPKFSGSSEKSISQLLRKLLWDLEESDSFGVGLSGNGLVVFENGLSASLYQELEPRVEEDYGWLSRDIVVRNFSAPEEVMKGEEFSFELGWRCSFADETKPCGNSLGSMPFVALVPNGEKFTSFYDAVYGIFLPLGRDVHLSRFEQTLEIPQNVSPGIYKICLGWYELIPTEMSGNVKLKDAVELGQVIVK